MPIKPIQQLIKWFTEPKAIVLDPFMGSGTTAEACLKLDRRFLGIELSRKFVDMGTKRIKPYLEQTKLQIEGILGG